ncbi:MAG: adenylate/guanylate cyclase domain-containing protein [Myxococcales bacterium]
MFDLVEKGDISFKLGQVTALENLLRSEGLVRAPRSLDAVLAFFLSFMGAMLSVASTRTTRMRRTALVELVLGALIVGGYLHWISVWYRGGLWVSAVLPLGGFVAALFVATAINYADESKTAGVVTDALGRYTSPAIVDEILRNPRYLSLEGDARELTVFFSDIKDFTTISERLPAQQLVRMLNDYLTAVTEVIGRTHGHVDKFIGDAVMAYWGAPIPNKLHAVDACRCAIQLRDLLTKKRPEWKEKYGLELYARAGLNTGEMVVGNMGSKGARQKVNYTVIGDAVNLASRLEGTNKVYGTEILIGEGTFEAARDYIEVREIDLVRVKGKQRPARIFELLCMKGELTPEQRRFVEQFEAAIITYRKREFVEAAALFEAVLAERPSDGPSAIYLARCRAYVDHPPDPEWDGVFEMTGK